MTFYCIIYPLLDDFSRPNVTIGKDDSLITNEELITPSSFASSKSCNEICAHDVPDSSPVASDTVKEGAMHFTAQTEKIDKNSLPKW